MVKLIVKFILQKSLGFDRFLFIFSLFTINRLRLFNYDKEFRHFLNMIPVNGTVLDIGSNIGITAVPLAKRVSGGKVYCFEPISRYILTLRKIVQHYRITNIEIFETALGAEQCELVMVTPEFYKVKFQGFSHVLNKSSASQKGERLTVHSERLDNVRTIQMISKIHAIKIDVENFEFDILKGAELLLRQHKPLIYCEIWDNEKRWLTIHFLKELGYQVKVFDRNKLIDFTDQSVINFFFI